MLPPIFWDFTLKIDANTTRAELQPGLGLERLQNLLLDHFMGLLQARKRLF